MKTSPFNAATAEDQQLRLQSLLRYLQEEGFLLPELSPETLEKLLSHPEILKTTELSLRQIHAALQDLASEPAPALPAPALWSSRSPSAPRNRPRRRERSTSRSRGDSQSNE